MDEKGLSNEIYKLINSGKSFDEAFIELTTDDTDLGWNTRNELPEEIIDTVLI